MRRDPSAATTTSSVAGVASAAANAAARLRRVPRLAPSAYLFKAARIARFAHVPQGFQAVPQR